MGDICAYANLKPGYKFHEMSFSINNIQATEGDCINVNDLASQCDQDTQLTIDTAATISEGEVSETLADYINNKCGCYDGDDGRRLGDDECDDGRRLLIEHADDKDHMRRQLSNDCYICIDYDDRRRLDDDDCDDRRLSNKIQQLQLKKTNEKKNRLLKQKRKTIEKTTINNERDLSYDS